MMNQPASAFRALRLSAVATVVLLASACKDSGPPPVPTVVTVEAGGTQLATVNTAVALAPSVKVVDAKAKGVSDVPVTFTTADGGTVATASARTNKLGIASAGAWTLGTLSGQQTLTATVAGLAPVTFQATAVAGPPALLVLVTPPSDSVTSGQPFGRQPVLELRDTYGNLANAAASVSAALASGAGTLSGGTVVVSSAGRAAFTNLAYSGSDPFRLRFISTGIPEVQSANVVTRPYLGCTGAGSVVLNYTLGQTTRSSAVDPSSPRCLQFDVARNAGQQYLVMFENMPRLGDYGAALFPGVQPSSSAFSFGVSTLASGSTAAPVSSAFVQDKQLPAGMSHSWDFGAGPIYEFHPEMPAGGVPQPRVKRRNRNDLAYSSIASAPLAVGDTVIVFLSGISRLSIPSGNQKAVVRFSSNELAIVEDVRILPGRDAQGNPTTPALTRATGLANTPLTQEDMAEIARLYALQPKAQADLLFEGRFNQTTEANAAQMIAVHSIMPADNIWGYTYSSTNVFVWDFWVGTNGSAKGANQFAFRNAQSLFMHEIAHTRHWGLMERAGSTGLRGNLWLVEGFARFSERLPTVSYLLNEADPSRTGNRVLPFFPELNNSYFRDDVPTFLSIGLPMTDGYANSSFIFDYLADQVAARGGNWRAALRSFLTAGGDESTLDAAVGNVLPGLTFGQLFTRARLALYLDDIGTAGLPDWTQYLQLQLRASRPAGTQAAADARCFLVTPTVACSTQTAWPKLLPGVPFTSNRTLAGGAAFGIVIDGTGATNSVSVQLSAASVDNGAISITRIK